jgi:D-glycerate 3-kinase
MTSLAIAGAAIADWLKSASRPLFVGICGAQGSGKSTLAAALAQRFNAASVATAAISLDDFYLTQAERASLAAAVHPLLRTRGVPGTHDVVLGQQIFRELDSGRRTSLPRFDKARDDRAPREQCAWSPVATRLVIFEGWCVGALPEAAAALAAPINALERERDPDGSWRRFVNDSLAGEYQTWFSRLDRLVLLAAPGFEVVGDWRIEQERSLAREATAHGAQLMSDAEVLRFIQYYERLTRHILVEMPGRVDLVISLSRDRAVISTGVRHAGYRG